MKGKRDKIVLSTKVRMKMGDGSDESGLSKRAIHRAIEDSLRRLQTDYVDIYYLHQPDYDVPIEETLEAMEELVSYDPHLVVGILGGSAGTTYDAFKLLAEARKHGARAALFGRKINNSECQLAFVEFLRRIADGQLGPEEAVRAAILLRANALARLNGEIA